MSLIVFAKAVIVLGAALLVWILSFYKIILPRRLAGLVDRKTGKPVDEEKSPKFPFGNFPDLSNDFWGTSEKWMTPNCLKLFWVVTEPFLNITDADIGKNILTQPDSNYIRTSSHLYILRRIEGDGIIWATGEEWRRLHRILASSFTPKIVKSVAPTVQDIVDNELMPKIAAFAKSGEPVDVMRIFQYFAMKVVVQTSLGGSMNVDYLVDQMIFLVAQLSNPLFLIPGWHYLPTPHNRKVEKTFQELDSIIFKVIAKRRVERDRMSDEEKADVKNLLDMMLGARDEQDGAGLTDKEIRDNVMTFILAGSDTTSTSMAWFLVHLSQNSEALAKLRQEIEAVTGGNKMQINTADQFPYYQAAVSETMRLTPPIFSCIGRTTRQTEAVGDWEVPQGICLTVSIQGVGQNPKYWTDPLAYRPERFLKENSDKLHPYAAIPFGAGRRFCIGKGFALNEMHICLITLLQQFNFEMIPDKNVQLPWKAHPPSVFQFPMLHPHESIRKFKFVIN